MTNEEREALIVWARERNAEMNAEETRALLSALDEARADATRAMLDRNLAISGQVLAERERDEARGQLAALHAAASDVVCDPCPFHDEDDCDETCREGNEHATLRAALSDTAAAAKAHEARVRESVERERDAAIARADAAETSLADARKTLATISGDVLVPEDGAPPEKWLRIGPHAARAIIDERDGVARGMTAVADERDTLAAALAQVRERASVITYVKAWADTLEAYKPTGDEVRTAARLAEQLRAALDAAPVDLAAQRDARARDEGVADGYGVGRVAALREARDIVIEQERRAWAAAEGARSDRLPVAAERWENKAEALSDAAEEIRKLADEAEKGGA